MELETYDNDANPIIVNANFGCKFAKSVYIVANRHSATSFDEIIDYFMESDIESAIRRVVEKRLFQKFHTLYLMTGDGQEVRLTKRMRDPS